MTTALKRSTLISPVILAFITFVVLGMPDGTLGVAWPSVRQDFRIPLDALGALLISTRLGYLAASFSSGRLIARWGVGIVLVVSALVRAAGLLGYSTAPTWWIMVLWGLASGLGGGAIDSAANTHFAMYYSPRLMNWLHASFGLGATTGPIVMTWLLTNEQSWRWGYAVIGLLQLIVLGLLYLSLNQWQDRPQAANTLDPGRQRKAPRAATNAETLRLPAVWLSIGIFFLYAGIELTAGQWSFSLFTESRGVSVATAGLWVGMYWGTFTAGRIVYGIIGNRLRVVTTLRVSMIGATLAALLIWWNISNTLSFIGLAGLGFALAPVFPLLVTETPRRLGLHNAGNAIGFQVGAAGLGIAALPGFVGVLATWTGLEIIGPFLVVACAVTYVLYEVLPDSAS